MEPERITLPPLATGGEVTTLYAYDSSAARNTVLAGFAHQLAGRAGATTPVLLVDWDTTAPGLHSLFEAEPCHPGLLEWAAGLLLQLREAAAPGDGEADERAALALEAHDWRDHVQRIDQGRPLYLMAAGSQHQGYGERAAAFDWQALFHACPGLFRAMMEQLGRHFAHILVAAPCGRSAAASICTALLPRRLVALFLPSRPSLDGACAMVARAVEARCASPLEERPLQVYPLPAGPFEPHWRAVCQPRWEAVLGDAHGISQLRLDAWFGEVGEAADAALAWIEHGHAPWQSLAELSLLQAIAASTPGHPGRDWQALGELYQQEGRPQAAQQCFQAAMEARQRQLGDEHADTRASRSSLAALLLEAGKLAEARFLYELLVEDGERLLGVHAPATLAARTGLATTLGRLDPDGEGLEALEAAVLDCEEGLGASHPLTLACLLEQAAVLAHIGEPGRARILVERVLDARWRQLGSEHPLTLAAMQQLAVLLCQAEDQANAVRLQQKVVDGHYHQHGERHPSTQAARGTLAAIVAGDVPLPVAVPPPFLHDTNGRAGRGLLQVKSSYENSDQQ